MIGNPCLQVGEARLDIIKDKAHKKISLRDPKADVLSMRLERG